jgi:uncharacterized cupin superfamily protein
MSGTPRPAVNAITVELEPWTGALPGFRARHRGLGRLLGGELIDASVYELDPGERGGPYHYEFGREEALLVLSGTPTLRYPEGRELLAPGDFVAFQDGPAGAHQLINESQELVRYMMFSVNREPFCVVYPDSGKVSTIMGMFKISDAVNYWDGESSE